MNISLIIAVYKDVISLDLIIRALKNQTYNNFEVIIAEDGESDEMKEYIKTINGLNIKHTTQKDDGIRKASSLNNAILASSCEYLIFIDGDCIPYSTFIEGHMKLREIGKVLTGRRVNLNKNISQQIRDYELNPYKIEQQYYKYYSLLKKDNGSHIEQGIYFDPTKLIYKLFLHNRQRTNTNLLGCNYSCFKQDIVGIGGYDEIYGETALADDTDLQWRFELYGLKMKSCKFVANIFHLYHDRSHREIDDSNELITMKNKQKNQEFFATRGIDDHKK